MQRVLVLDGTKKPLMPCHPARARQLLRKKKAAIYRLQPFTIILKERNAGKTQPLALKIDPGSRITGLAIVGSFRRGHRVIWCANIHHRGHLVIIKLYKRRQVRRNRRSRRTRYRKPRFSNRLYPKGWLAPSMWSRIGNVLTWVTRLRQWSPISKISIELSKFDTQKLENPEIKGVKYQQGTLAGYDVREYLLEKWKHRCAYCHINNIPLEIEHIVPISRGGSDRVSNLVLACRKCNLAKGNQTASEFGFSDIQTQAKQTMKDTAVMNITRWAIFERLLETGLFIEVGTGGRTNFNRNRQGYPKAHWLDAACVGKSGESVFVTPGHIPLIIKAMGRGTRQMCRMDRYGFPRTRAKKGKCVHGFQTGDLVRAYKFTGKNVGVHVGRIAVRRRGTFRMGLIDGLSWRNCHLLQRGDGYDYAVETTCLSS